MHIVLVEPEIPGNTGNIARLCAATGMELHLVRPLGFSTDEKHLRHAGLDYWHLVRVYYHNCFAEVAVMYHGHAFHYLSTKAPRAYTEAAYGADDFLVFGKESKGLPEDLLQMVWDRAVRIPMIAEARSLNLSNSVAIVAYEALRQQQFAGLSDAGPGLHI
ncbi:MAG: tRNA (cytidine(34)-2'-O)-methyltransferase [Selenomonas sp.]|uniref:tRNA (cytidine(34)-2'-O)-methyltransferase n=1 Tax=Selenomonas sp. TaxID=2053611 RepID=UPI0025F678AD|nr:tRNA (cytidine(34)-2'-O)-methyltransferase [Selenomonas sp.]MCI6085383.1 tRNA (cytidine(34)-2'-O)-methyltransferase [Selenomonas sp.]